MDIKWSQYIPHVPHPKQHAFLWLHNLEAMYGGAAAGGKSETLLMGALQWVEIPNYAALILRRTFTDLSLPGAIMDRSHQWLSNTDAKWNDVKKTWTFPSGATLTFGYLQTEKDKFRYQSAEFQYIALDELSQFPELDYTYMFSRLRKPEPPPGDPDDFTEDEQNQFLLSQVPLRMRSATNPGGPGHRWVRRRLIDKEPDDETDPQSRTDAAARVFVPSQLEDNPSVDLKAYESSLRALDPITQAQLRHGDWTVRVPGTWVFDAHAIEQAEALGREYDRMRSNGELAEPHGGYMLSGMDYGDFQTVMIPVWPLEMGGLYVPPTEIVNSREDLEDIAEDGMNLMCQFPFWWSEHRYDASFSQSNRTFAKVTERAMGMHNAIRRTGRPNTLPVSFAEYKMVTIKYLRLLLDRTVEKQTTRIIAISPKNHLLLDQLRDYEEDEFGKPQKGGDDAVDALIAGAAPMARHHRIIVEEALQKADPNWARLQPRRTDINRRLRRDQVA